MHEVVAAGGVADFLHIFANVRRNMDFSFPHLLHTTRREEDRLQSSVFEFFMETPT